MRPDFAPFQVFHQKVLFNGQQHKVVKSPGDKVPAGAMPDAGSRPDQEHIKKLPRRAFTVAAQGNVDVIPEPARKRDMPAPPKFGDATGDIRQIEVGRAIKAKQSSQAVAHLTVTGEVEIQLQAVRDNAQPCQRGRDIRQPHAARTDDISPQRTDGIRQNDFFCEAEHE